MKLKNQIIIGVVAVAALVGGFLLAQWLNRPVMSEPSQAAAMPKTMVNFTLPGVDGVPRQLSEWRGKLIVLNFWATWCPPCREEIPLFINMQEKYGTRGLQIIGVAIDKLEDVKNFQGFDAINYPVLVGQEEVMALMQRYGNRIGSLPYSVVIDRQGRVLSRRIGAYQPAEIETLLQGLLPDNSPG
jgi:thiol-disulfide isomerase/thioredoxin